MSVILFSVFYLFTTRIEAAEIKVQSLRIGAGGTVCGVTTVDADTGRFHCWGFNRSRVFLDSSSNSVPAPKLIQDIGEVLQVSTGTNFTCALLQNKKVKCWGENGRGQLGVGSHVGAFYLPVTSIGLPNIRDIEASALSVCAISEENQLYCWGANSSGQLGTNPSASIFEPQLVASNVKNITLNLNHACYTSLANEVFCSGLNSSGELGLGDIINRSSFTKVPNLNDVREVAVGTFTSCALMISGSIKCWGYGGTGQLGNNTYSNQRSPVDVSIISSAKQIQVGEFHTCALLVSGEMYCWGENFNGQLGIPGVSQRVSVPVIVPNLQSIEMISLGKTQTCAVANDGSLKCWGSNSYGSLGTNDYVEKRSPTSVQFDANYNDHNVKSLSLGGNHTCVNYANGSTRCFGQNTSGELGTGNLLNTSGTPLNTTILSKNTIKLVNGAGFTCSLTVNNKIFCWGLNNFGQLGNGTYSSYSLVPTEVFGISDAVDLSVGTFSACALLVNGSVKCWGINSSGQLGNGSSVSSNRPVQVLNLLNARNISVSLTGYHACATTVDKKLFCWGYNGENQLGQSTSTSFSSLPIIVPDLRDVENVRTGHYSTCTHHTDGSVKCWGWNSTGQLGMGDVISRNTPEPVPQLKKVKDIKLGSYHGCALFNDDSLKCWGFNSNGQVGNSTRITLDYPTKVIPDVVQFELGSFHTCATNKVGNILCWGSGAFGKLGFPGSTSDNLSPTILNLKKSLLGQTL